MAQTQLSNDVAGSGLGLPRGSTVARFTLLGFLLLSAGGALLRGHQALTRVPPGRALEFLWMFGAFQLCMAVIDGAALTWLERRRAAGFYLGAGAVAIHAARIHFDSMYHPIVMPANHTEAVISDGMMWAITAALAWVVSVLVRGGRTVALAPGARRSG